MHFGNHRLHIVTGDFTEQRVPLERFNLVLTIRLTFGITIATSQKDRLRQRIAHSLNFDVRLSWALLLLLLLCHEWMEDDGLQCG